MAEMLGFCPVISRSGPEKPLYGTKNRSQSPWNRPIWGAAREFDFRDEFAADSPLQGRVSGELAEPCHDGPASPWSRLWLRPPQYCTRTAVPSSIAPLIGFIGTAGPDS